MATSIVNNKEFRALLTRKGGATGKELQAFTGRAFVYSTWSLRCMETDTHELWTQKEGRETRYMLISKKRAAAVESRKAAAEKRKTERVAANANETAKPRHRNRKPVTITGAVIGNTATISA